MVIAARAIAFLFSPNSFFYIIYTFGYYSTRTLFEALHTATSVVLLSLLIGGDWHSARMEAFSCDAV